MAVRQWSTGRVRVGAAGTRLSLDQRNRLVALCVTGYLIGAPIRAFYAAEAYQQYWFGWVRFIHFLAAFVYVFNFLARLYWGFVGNKYSHWNAFFPLKKSQRQEIVDVVKADVFEVKMHGPISTGHNALAGFIYFGTFLAFCLPDHHRLRALLQHEQLLAAADVYLGRAVDGWRIRRALLAPYVPVVLCHLVIVHVYLAFYHDYIEGAALYPRS